MKRKSRIAVPFGVLVAMPWVLIILIIFILYLFRSEEFFAAQELIFDLFFAMAIVVCTTVICMVIWMHSVLIKPLDQLEKASQEIKEGNLDCEVKIQGHDELADLCQSFEEMRKRLKVSAEEQMRHERESRELISNISHDLKTPITAIKGYVEGILDGVADTPEKMDRYMRTIHNKTVEMDLLINELTIYSKIDSNRIPYNFNKINVSDYMSDCVEDIGMELDAKGVGLSYSNYVAKDVSIIIDPEQIRRVIQNIISNSEKYSEAGKCMIDIRVRDVGDFVQFELQDNGRGIAAKDLPYIFERFYRAEKSRNSATGGSGIGLSIVRKIIEDHGGKIWATSKENSGTTMYFVIRKYQEVPNE